MPKSIGGSLAFVRPPISKQFEAQVGNSSTLLPICKIPQKKHGFYLQNHHFFWKDLGDSNVKHTSWSRGPSPGLLPSPSRAWPLGHLKGRQTMGFSSCVSCSIGMIDSLADARVEAWSQNQLDRKHIMFGLHVFWRIGLCDYVDRIHPKALNMTEPMSLNRCLEVYRSGGSLDLRYIMGENWWNMWFPKWRCSQWESCSSDWMIWSSATRQLQNPKFLQTWVKIETQPVQGTQPVKGTLVHNCAISPQLARGLRTPG